MSAQTIEYDAAVIGTGFGGLAAALELASAGASVVLFERLNYPGGCASTFTRGGRRFESGATLFSGFNEGQLFNRLIKDHGMSVDVDMLDPLVTLRTDDFTLSVPADRHELVRRLCAMPGSNADALTRFFDFQEAVADTLWALFDDPALIPPFGTPELLRHIKRSSRYLRLLPLIGRPLADVLRRFGLEHFTPLRTYLNAVCQITVQAGIEEAEAPFALAAMDYYFRGTGHVTGGVGVLAWEMARAFERLGGTIHFTDEVQGVSRADDRWIVTSRRRTVEARVVIANLLPAVVERITSTSTPYRTAGVPRCSTSSSTAIPRHPQMPFTWSSSTTRMSRSSRETTSSSRSAASASAGTAHVERRCPPMSTCARFST